MSGCLVKLLVLKSRAYFALVLSWRLVFRVLVFEQLVVFVMVVVMVCMIVMVCMVCMVGKHGKAFHAFGAFDKSCPS